VKVAELRAKIRRNDRDIRLGVGRLELKEGELPSDIVREAVMLLLIKRGLIGTVDDMKCFERSGDDDE